MKEKLKTYAANTAMGVLFVPAVAVGIFICLPIALYHVAPDFKMSMIDGWKGSFGG